MGHIFVLFFIFGALIPPILSLNCYTCSIGEQDVDKTCAEDAVKGAVIKNCNKKYCTIIRIEFKDPKNKVSTFMRGCEDKPLGINTVVEDATHRTYYMACQTDLCNGGSGKGADSSQKIGALGDKSVIYAPGTGNTAHFVRSSIFILLTSLLIYLY